MDHSITKEFDKISEHADAHWWYVGMRRSALTILRRFLPEQSRTRRILEIGCGTGVNLPYLAELGAVEGLEYDPYALDLARRTGYHCFRGDMHQLALPPNHYDLIVFFEVLNQAERSAHDSIMAGVVAALAPGGLVVLREPALESLRGNHDVEWSTKARFSKREIERLFASANLEVVYVGYLNFFLAPIVFVKRALDRLTGLRAESDYRVHSRLVNSLFATVLAAERYLTRYVRFP